MLETEAMLNLLGLKRRGSESETESETGTGSGLGLREVWEVKAHTHKTPQSSPRSTKQHGSGGFSSPDRASQSSRSSSDAKVTAPSFRDRGYLRALIRWCLPSRSSDSDIKDEIDCKGVLGSSGMVHSKSKERKINIPATQTADTSVVQTTDLTDTSTTSTVTTALPATAGFPEIEHNMTLEMDDRLNSTTTNTSLYDTVFNGVCFDIDPEDDEDDDDEDYDDDDFNEAVIITPYHLSTTI